MSYGDQTPSPAVQHTSFVEDSTRGWSEGSAASRLGHVSDRLGQPGVARASSSRPSSGDTSGTDPPGVIIPYQDNLERANATIRQQALQLHQKEIEIDNLRSDIRSLIGALPQSRNARPSRPSRSSPLPSPSASAEPLSAPHSANALAPITASPRTAPETPAPAHQAHPIAPAAVANSAPLEPIEGGQTSHVKEREQRTSWGRRIGSRISKLARRT